MNSKIYSFAENETVYVVVNVNANRMNEITQI